MMIITHMIATTTMMNKIYYFEVLVDNLSICIDSEVAYYHYFKKGDIFEYFYERNSIGIDIPTVKINDVKYPYDRFVIDWDKINSWSSISLMPLLQKEKIVEITSQVKRDNKLTELGI